MKRIEPKSLRPFGLTTLAAQGPFWAGELDEDARWYVCDRGHRAIAWDTWDGPWCPICERAGIVSGELGAQVAKALDDARDERDAETGHEKLWEAAYDARRSLEGCLGDDVPEATRNRVQAACDKLDKAL